MTLEEMKARRDALRAARWRGVRSVSVDGREVTYKTDAEMANALDDLDRRIASEERGGGRSRRLYARASKGL
mgnify:CR=1 FL=1